MRITKWISSGNLDFEAATSKELLESAGDLMDDCCTSEILGTILFLAADGKYYTCTVEAVVSEAHPDFVQQILADAALVKKTGVENEIQNLLHGLHPSEAPALDALEAL